VQAEATPAFGNEKVAVQPPSGLRYCLRRPTIILQVPGLRCRRCAINEPPVFPNDSRRNLKADKKSRAKLSFVKQTAPQIVKKPRFAPGIKFAKAGVIVTASANAETGLR